MLILGIETSCDETAASVIEVKKVRTQDLVFIRSNIVSSQIDIHKKYGGVVPEVAAREHVLNILPVINEALVEAGIKRKNAKSCIPTKKKIDVIAVATGPGLITSLITGVETAKTLAYSWDIPVVSVNHIEGHIYANFIDNYKFFTSRSLGGGWPALILTVSGGHTMLVLMKGIGKFETIGETRDDAAGEAFDKAAKLMNIGYPGGPVVSAEAAKFLNSKSEILNKSKIQNPKSKIVLPRPMINSNNFDFSFSGLKTALLYELQKLSKSEIRNLKSEICYEFQQAVIDVLIHKTIKAAKKYKAKTIMLAGGVSANQELRKQMKEKINALLPNSKFLIPKMEYTTDNAVMIAMAGYYKAKQKKFTPWQKLIADCNLELK